MAYNTANLFRNIGLRSAKQSIIMLLVAWTLSLVWLGVNYFWKLASVEVIVAVPVLSLVYALIALAAYIYWGIRDVRERDRPYANLVVGVIVAVTLLYFNFSLLQYVLQAVLL